MGMTIEDTKMHLYMQESYALGKDYMALETALYIIRKYQKIEQIIKDWEGGRFSDAVGCLRIKVVLEDGNAE